MPKYIFVMAQRLFKTIDTKQNPIANAFASHPTRYERYRYEKSISNYFQPSLSPILVA